MTIAAGFVCGDGIVLCADTHHTGAIAAKTHHAKLGNFDCPGGKIAVAVAGNRNLAWAAVQKLRNELAATPPDDTFAVMERVLDKEYRKHVFANPAYLTQAYAYDYWLLIAVWKPLHSLQLFATSQTSIRIIDGFECIGVGAELANYLITPCFFLHLPTRKTVPLATYALANVKDSIEGCGGSTIFQILRHDGSVSPLTTMTSPWEQIEKFSKTFDTMTRLLFLQMADLEISDSNFEHNLTRYSIDLMKARREWSQVRSEWEDAFARHNPSLTSFQVGQAYLRWTMGLSPVPPPSQESPGGSGES